MYFDQQTPAVQSFGLSKYVFFAVFSYVHVRALLRIQQYPVNTTYNKIIGAPLKEGIVRLEVKKHIFN